MEDLLASIRKAINEDIGDPAARQMAAKSPQPRAPEAKKPVVEAAGSSSEIQQLRAKITRARSGGSSVPPPEPTQRAASLSAALQNDTPRRSWLEIEPNLPPSRLRGSVSDVERTSGPKAPETRPRSLRALDTPVQRIAEEMPRGEPAGIISGSSAQAVQSAFSQLADSVLARATGERSIEEITRELLRGMLKQWLDDNLPAMVERLVREEIERVARTGR